MKMVLTSNFINFVRGVEPLRDDLIIEAKKSKHMLAKIKWMKEFFTQYIEEESNFLCSSLSMIVINTVDWERVVKVFQNEKVSE